MASLEQEIKQSKFDNELLKANINIMFTANWLYNKISSTLNSKKALSNTLIKIQIAVSVKSKSVTKTAVSAKNCFLTAIID